MTPQEAFDAAVRGLASQRWDRSLRARKTGKRGRGMVCAYRGGGGRRCAVGWIIPDSEYSEQLEGKSVSFFRHDWEVQALCGLPFDFLYALQTAHDAATHAADMTERLRRVAKAFSLECPAEMGVAP